MGLSDKRKLLLKKAANQDGILKLGMATQLYASKDSAISAIASLEFQGYIEKQVPGVFEVKKLPDDVKQEIKSESDED